MATWAEEIGIPAEIEPTVIPSIPALKLANNHQATSIYKNLPGPISVPRFFGRCSAETEMYGLYRLHIPKRANRAGSTITK